MNLQNGSVLGSPEVVHEGAMIYFSQILSDSHRGKTPKLRHLLSPIIIEDDNAKILALPSEEEFKETVKSIPVDSSLKSDGFGLRFYITCWNSLKRT